MDFFDLRVVDAVKCVWREGREVMAMNAFKNYWAMASKANCPSHLQTFLSAV